MRVQSGPLKGGVYYTPYASAPYQFFKGEPLILTGAKKIAGESKKYDLTEFYDAYSDGNESKWQGYLVLREVVLMAQGTRVEVENSEEASSVVVQVRVTSGPMAGKLLYVLTDHTMFAYDPPDPAPKASRKRRKG